MCKKFFQQHLKNMLSVFSIPDTVLGTDDYTVINITQLLMMDAKICLSFLL